MGLPVLLLRKSFCVGGSRACRNRLGGPACQGTKGGVAFVGIPAFVQFSAGLSEKPSRRRAVRAERFVGGTAIGHGRKGNERRVIRRWCCRRPAEYESSESSRPLPLALEVDGSDANGKARDGRSVHCDAEFSSETSQ